MSRERTGYINFFSSEDIDIQVALTLDMFLDSLGEGTLRSNFLDSYSRCTGTVFNNMCGAIGFKTPYCFDNEVDGEGLRQYIADFTCEWDEMVPLFLQHLVSFGMGIQGIIYVEDGIGRKYSAKSGSNMLTMGEVTYYPDEEEQDGGKYDPDRDWEWNR